MVTSITATPIPAKKPRSLKTLSAAAEKAEAGAAVAKDRVRAAKAELKKARKFAKSAKRAAKLARKKVEAATVVDKPADAVKSGKPTKVVKVAKVVKVPKVVKAPNRKPVSEARRPASASAAQVAKAVITRMSEPAVSAVAP